MKKLLLIVTIVGSFAFAQEPLNSEPIKIAQNELSLNLPVSIFAEFPMISYERLASANLGFGASVGFSLNNDDNLNSKINFEAIPFVRWYFLNSGNETVFGRKFFIEANAGILSYSKNIYNSSTYEDNKKSEVGLGLGAAIGYKYVNTSNWIGSIYLGGGKTFGENEIGYPHLGVNIGKRF